MKRYVAIDSGKDATKVVEYLPDEGGVRRFSIKTKASEGDFRDDAIEEETVVVRLGDKVLKVGSGARGLNAELETDKRSEIHRACALTALSYLASPDGSDEFCVAVGLPVKEWAVVSKRVDFKDYILPDEEMETAIKKTSTSPVAEKRFKVVEKYAFPESSGPLFADEMIEEASESNVVGVLDIGELNLNATLWVGNRPQIDMSLTAELGEAILVQELSQELSANVVTCDEFIARSIIANGLECLPNSGNLTEEQVESSRRIIKAVLKRHAENVKRQCRARGWSLDIMKVVATGGTSLALKRELQEAFGPALTVVEDPVYCNANGYLRMMCARIPEISKVVPLDVVRRQGKQKG